MQLSSKFKSQSQQCRVIALGAAYLLAFTGMLIGTEALAQNLDAGKSAVRLFADSCVTCHRSPRGLAKGRYRVTLFMFLRDHYASNTSSALELASYLASVDTPQRGKSRSATAHPPAAASSKQRSSMRPPKPVSLP